MRVAVSALLMAPVCVAVASALWAESPQKSASRCELRPVLIENFDELSVHPSRIGPARWTAHTPWSGDFGDAVFIDPGADGPFSVENGILRIKAAKDASGRWTSGLLAAADATGAGHGARYGYFEARMKIPPGPGTWPAFWLAALKPADQRDGNVEIDVIEYYGQFTSAYRSSVHVWFTDKTKYRGNGSKTDVPDHSLVDAFHTYGVDVSPQRILFFIDGRQVWEHPTPPELTTPMFPLVNLALGSGWPIDKTPDPSVLEVDYIHVYERDAGPPEGCIPGPPHTPDTSAR